MAFLGLEDPEWPLDPVGARRREGDQQNDACPV